MKKKEIFQDKKEFIQKMISLDWILLFAFLAEAYPSVIERFERFISNVERELEIEEIIVYLFAFFERAELDVRVIPTGDQFEISLYYKESKNIIQEEESLFPSEELARKALAFACFEALSFIFSKENLDDSIRANLS